MRVINQEFRNDESYHFSYHHRVYRFSAAEVRNHANITWSFCSCPCLKLIKLVWDLKFQFNNCKSETLPIE